MPRLKLVGDLNENLNNMFDLYDNIFSATEITNGVAFSGISGSGFHSMATTGTNGFDVLTSGTEFVTGTVKKITLSSPSKTDLFEQTVVLKFNEFRADAEDILDLLRREEDGIFVRSFGTIDNKGVKKLLNTNDWKIVGSGEEDTVTSSNKMTLAGADEIYGKSGRDVLHGGRGGDEIYGGAGIDLVLGQKGADLLMGDNGSDKLNGGSGKDKLNGGDDADVIIGGADGDRLIGERGGDRLVAGGGRDILTGGVGADIMIGGKGADQFIFKDGHGNDVIKDFQTGIDTLSFADPRDLTFAEVDGDTIISYDGGSLTLKNIDADDLSLVGDFWS